MMITQSRKVEVILDLAKNVKSPGNNVAKKEINARRQWSDFLSNESDEEFRIAEAAMINRLCGPALVLDIILTDIGYYKTIGSDNQPPLSYM